MTVAAPEYFRWSSHVDQVGKVRSARETVMLTTFPTMAAVGGREKSSGQGEGRGGGGGGEVRR